MSAHAPRPADRGRPARPPQISATLAYHRLLYADFGFFMSQLRDPAGALLIVAAHHRRWCRLVAGSKRLVLLAPRNHGKSYLGLVYVMWSFYRHGRDPLTGQPLAGPTGVFQAVMFSATHDQAAVLMATFRDLLRANEWLFGSVSAAIDKAALSGLVAWSRTHVRLASGAELRTRAYRTSTRGLHPTLLLLDDVLNDGNSLSEHQRDLTWKYLVGTLLPMGANQVLILGTAFHQNDLLHRLAPRPSSGSALSDGTGAAGLVHGFEWHKFRALDSETETALWPARHSAHELMAFRDAEPTVFSREYMNEPRDELSTYFPRSLTQPAVDAGASMTLVPVYRKVAREWVVLGADLARSERIGADYTVAIVAAFDGHTGQRRVLAARRARGLDFAAQLDLFTDLAISYGVDLAFIEQNGFQGWLVDELRKRPGGGVFFGHTTGRNKMRLDADGIPMLKIALVHGLWVVPSGDELSRGFARVWQAELGAFGWRDGRVESAGEHDDVVVASWYVELAVAAIIRWLATPADELVTMEDLGIQRVRIGPDNPYDPPSSRQRWDIHN